MESSTKQSTSSKEKKQFTLDEPRNQVLIAITLFSVGVFESIIRFIRIRLGSESPHSDVTTTWQPFAEKTLSGVPLYLGTPTDNKPPLFEYLNLTVATTGNYLAIFLLLIGLVNGGIAYLLWQTRAERGHHTAGVVSGLLFLAAVPLVSGHAINVRSFTLLGILLALRSPWPAASGLAVASAGLMSQYAVFALPAIVYDRLKRIPAQRRPRWLSRFTLTTAIAVSVTYLSVYLVWGEASLIASLRWSIGSVKRYVVEWTPSLWNGMSVWAKLHGRTVVRIGAFLVFGVIGSAVTIRRSLADDESCGLERQALAFAGLLSVPLLVRPFTTYWMYPLPWLTTLSTTGLFAVGERFGITDLTK